MTLSALWLQCVQVILYQTDITKSSKHDTEIPLNPGCCPGFLKRENTRHKGDIPPYHDPRQQIKDPEYYRAMENTWTLQTLYSHYYLSSALFRFWWFVCLSFLFLKSYVIWKFLVSEVGLSYRKSDLYNPKIHSTQTYSSGSDTLQPIMLRYHKSSVQPPASSTRLCAEAPQLNSMVPGNHVCKHWNQACDTQQMPEWSR